MRLSQASMIFLAVIIAGLSLSHLEAAVVDEGYISGFINDARGTPLAGVLVTLLDGTFNPRVVKKVTTDGSGQFEIKNLLPGSYALSVSLASYLPLLKPGIEVVAGKMARLNLSLQNLYQEALFADVTQGNSSDNDEDIRSVLRTASSTRPILRIIESTRNSDAQINLDLLRPSVALDQTWHGSVYAYSTAYSADPDYPDLGGAFTEFVFVKDFNPSSRWLIAGTVSRGGFTEFESMLKWKNLKGHNPSLRVSLGMAPYFHSKAPARQGQLQRLNFFNLDFEDEVAISQMVTAIYGLELQMTTPSVDARRVRPRWGFRVRPLRDSQLSFVRTKSTPKLYRKFPLKVQEDFKFVSPFRHNFGSKMQLGQTEITHTEIVVDQEIDKKSKFLLGVYSDEFSPGKRRIQASAGSPSQIFSKGLRIAYKRDLGDRIHTGLGYTFGGGAKVSKGVSDLNPENYHVMVARLETDLDRSKTQVAATYRWISGISLTVIDPYQEFFESSAPGLSLIVSQTIPYVGRFIPGELEAQFDLLNLFNQYRIDSVENGSEFRYSEFLQTPRSVRGGIKLKF